MGALEVKVPVLPESVAEATVVTWHRKPGDAVRRDENLVDLETDKVVLEVPAPADGVLVEVLQADGATVSAQDVLCRIDPQASARVAAVTAAATPAPAPAPVEAAPAPVPAPAGGGRAGPAARHLMEQHGLAPEGIQGSGPGGRITKDDVQRQIQSRPEAPAHAAPVAPAAQPTATAAGERPERRVTMSRLRARIAERLLEAQHDAAILTTFNEVNLAEVTALRNRYRERFEQVHGVRLGFMSFFVAACVEGLKRYPVINASVDGEDIVYHDYYDIGVAVASPRGLVVPVLRDVDRMDFASVERRINDFVGKAREGTLALEDLAGGTFTITNGGVFGSMLSTPILNPPQSAILGMHKIQDRPVVEDGEVRVRPMMYLAVSYDHRIIDGKDAVQFLVTVKECLEDPARLMLGV